MITGNYSAGPVQHSLHIGGVVQQLPVSQHGSSEAITFDLHLPLVTSASWWHWNDATWIFCVSVISLGQRQGIFAGCHGDCPALCSYHTTLKRG